MVGVGLVGRGASRDELVGGALDGLPGRAQRAGRLGDGDWVTGEDAEGVPARVGFALWRAISSAVRRNSPAERRQLPGALKDLVISPM